MDIKEMIFNLIDEFKFLYFPEEWSDTLLNFSKNEIFVLLYLYKNEEANMTNIAEYIKAPLNTTTGVVNSLIKKELTQRVRSTEDRRIVFIKLTEKAIKMIEQEVFGVENYFNEIYSQLTSEEISVVMGIFQKVKNILQNKKNDGQQSNSNKKIRKITID